MTRFLIAVATTLVASLAPVAAQSTWNGGGGNGNWNTPANWTGGTPTSTATTAIVLDGTTNTITTQNIADPLVLNSLTLGANATGGFTINGGALQFQGSNATVITQQAGTTPSALRINSAVQFSANTTIDVQGNVTAANSGAELNFAGGISGNATVTVNGVGGGITLFSQANSTFGGTIAYQSSASGQIMLAANNAVGRATVVNLTGPSATSGASFRVGVTSVAAAADTSASVQLASLIGTNASTNAVFNVGATAQTGQSTALVGFDNTSTTYNSTGTTGGISLNGSAANRNSFFGKVGTGTLTLGGNSSSGFGAYQVRDGSIVLAGTNGRFSSASAEIQIYAGATLRADNTASNQQDRLPGNTSGSGDRSIVLSGGTLQLTGNAGANTSEGAAGVRLTSGQSTILVDGTAASRAHRLNFSSTVANGGGISQLGNATATVFFRSTNLGQQSSTSGSNVGAVTFSDATALPTLIGGSGEGGSTIISILAYGFGTGATSASTVTNAESFVTYSTVNNSIRSLTDAEYATSFGTATANVSVSGAATVDTATTANAVRIVSGGSVANSSTLTVTSGAVLNNGGGNITGGGTLAFGTAGTPTTAYLTTNGAFGIGNALAAANLSKNGAGNLTLTGATTLTTNGTVAVNAGTLTLGAGSSVANASTYQISRGATLDVSANGLSLITGQTLRGSGSVTGNVTLNTAATVAPSSLAGSAANLASPGVLTVNGNLTLGGGGRYDWYVSSAQGGQYTQSQIVVGGNLDLSGLSAANRFVLRPTSLLLSNSGAGDVYDFDSNIARNPAGYSWTLISSTGITGGFSADKFQVDVSGFSNNLNGGLFTVGQVGNNIVLNFTPVPEPATVLAVGAAGLAAADWLRRRRATPATAA